MDVSCQILTYNDIADEYGLGFRPIPGNNVFWFDVDELKPHAGRLPRENGLKIELNTWAHLSILDN